MIPFEGVRPGSFARWGSADTILLLAMTALSAFACFKVTKMGRRDLQLIPSDVPAWRLVCFRAYIAASAVLSRLSRVRPSSG